MAMNKIAVRGGHNFSVPGASGIISETKEDRLVKDAIIKYLRAAGKQVLDVTAPDSCNTILSDLAYGVDKANNWGADLFISVHFNNAYSTYDGALGSEVLVYNTFPEAQKAMDALASLGFKSRGVKLDRGLYELRKTDMPSFLVEVCFVEATKDVALYRSLGADKIGKTIVEKLVGKSLPGGSTGSGSTGSGSGSTGGSTGSKPLWEVSINGPIVSDLQRELNRQFNAGLTVDGYFGESTLKACPLVREGASGGITKIIQRRLLERGYTSLNNHGGADGSFGAGTTTAIKNLQRNKGLTVDGIVGRDTWKALFSK